ncbi:uncharacterized protein LOC114340297 isoform X1 [Diabrotica virgifera virgifera]|uniref:Uncharacterized protein LOC114340297 isoform X1 n=1 Tax=Diabrotica virgifera virgifera TaxID=50390 RepID=A0A6P7GC15_DIAVI|nr:uncharacterized protein LOC114340297 isoform X1 [Diabrotica virgifera virgifera]
MSTIVLLLMLLVYQVMCVPPRCQEVNVETDEVSGQCCLFFKNNIESSRRTEVIQRFLKSVNTAFTSRREHSNIQTEVFPNHELRRIRIGQIKPVQTIIKNNSDEGVANKKLLPEDVKIITPKLRTNIDLMDNSCAEGFMRNFGGMCVEVFD